jgi:predicted  nucleic acid-binding Zn-ribbon protein
MEIEAIKKTWTKAVLEMANLEKRIGTMHRRITNRIQDMEKRIWGLEDKIEEIDISIGKG